MNDNELAVGGDVEISTLVLYDYKDNSYDISNMFSEIELYEDMFSHSLSGSITMVDTNNLIENLPIIGEEKIELVFKTPGFPESARVTQVFSVYKLGTILTPTPHKQIYTLYFTTPESIIDLNSRITKAFTGTPNNIISRILGSNGLQSIKETEFDSSTNNLKFVAPSWNPFRCINYLTSRAQSSDGFKASDFVFYETNKKYVFTSLNSIYENGKEPKIKYFYNNDPARNGVLKESYRDVEAELMKIYDLHILEKFNVLNRYENGFYSHFVWDHNILLKTITKRGYYYKEDFDKTAHLSESKVSSDNILTSKNTALSVLTTYPQVHNDMSEDNYGKVLTKKLPLLEQLNTVKLEITVNGRSDLEVGTVINVNIGGLGLIVPDEKNEGASDSRYNGNYLVTSIMHRLTLKKHAMVLNIARESVETEYA